MPLIITATDFSEVGKNAASYACQLAALQHAQVAVIHSFNVPVMFSDIPMPTSLINEAQADADNQMAKLVAELKAAYPALIIKGKVIFGNTIDALEDYADEHTEPWLVVVGNSSLGDNSSWPDSVLMDAFRQLKYPVLAVPPHSVYKPVKNICLAFDNKHDGNDIALQQLKNITLQLNTQLHVLIAHADKGQDNFTIDEHAKSLLDPVSPRYTVVEDSNIDQAIQNFVTVNNIDWLIMIPRRHSFFEGLFHKSHTKAIVHHTDIPIVALHNIQE